MQGWVFGKWNFSEQRWSGAIFYRAQCRDRRRFPRIWFLNCKKSSWHLTPLSFLSWFGLFVYSKKRKASDPASQPKASQIQKVPILKRPHDISQRDNKTFQGTSVHYVKSFKIAMTKMSRNYCSWQAARQKSRLFKPTRLKTWAKNPSLEGEGQTLRFSLASSPHTLLPPCTFCRSFQAKK